MKRILMMTIQIIAIWVVLALFLYTWNKHHVGGFSLPAFDKALPLPEIPAVCGVICG